MQIAHYKKIEKHARFILPLLIVTVLFLLQIFSPTYAGTTSAQKPIIDSDKAFVCDIKTGAIVYSKGEENTFNPRDLNKLMTALVVADEKNLTDGDLDNIKKMLKESDNTHADAFAKEISGSVTDFCKKMNEKAKALGCKETSFTTAGGVGDKKSKISAGDMSLILDAFFDNKDLKSTVIFEKKDGDKTKAKYATIGKGNDKSQIYTIALVQKDDTMLISVCIGGASTETNQADSDNLLKYGIKNYRTYIVVAKGESAGHVKIKGGQRIYVKGYAKDDLCVTLPKEGEDSLVKTEITTVEDLKAPVKKNKVIGQIKAIEAGTVTAQVDLVTKKEIKQGGPWSKIGLSDYMFFGICAILFLLIILIIIIKIKKKKRQKRIEALQEAKRQKELERIEKERLEKRRRDWPY